MFRPILFGTIATIVGAVIITAVTIVWRSGYLSLRNLKKTISMTLRMQRAGIYNFFSSRSDYVRYRGQPSLTDYLSSAKDSVLIVAYWMAQGNEAEGIAATLAQMASPPKSVNITVVIINPSGPFIDALSNYMDIERSQLVSRVSSSLMNLHNCWSRLGDDAKARFSIRVYDTVPMASVIALDGEAGRLQIDLKAYKTPREYSFAFELRGPDGPLHSRLLSAFQKLAEDSEVFDPNRHIPT